jgi:hypothetical protein
MVVKNTDMVGRGEEEAGVGGIGGGEGEGGGSESGGNLSSQIRARAAGIDHVDIAGNVHVLRPFPARMVEVRIAHLYTK